MLLLEGKLQQAGSVPTSWGGGEVLFLRFVQLHVLPQLLC